MSWELTMKGVPANFVGCLWRGCTEVFVVTQKGIDDDSPTAQLQDFLFSEAGQKVLYKWGMCRLRSDVNLP